MLKNISCPLCEDGSFKILFNSPPHLSDTSTMAQITTDVFSGYGRIVECRNCGFIYTNPRMDDEKISDAYRDMENQDYMKEFECRNMNALLSLLQIKKFIGGGRLLDIGCSVGFLLNAARVDFEPMGIELSAWARAIASKKFGLRVLGVPLEQASLEKDSFDVVTSIDVIEHVLNPREHIQQIGRVLKNNGILYLVTPDIKSLSAKFMGSYWWGLRPAHIQYFSIPTMKTLLLNNGFDVIQVKSYGRIFTYSYWLTRLKNYPWCFKKPVEWLVKILNMEDKILYLNTRDSMEIIARKKSA